MINYRDFQAKLVIPDQEATTLIRYRRFEAMAKKARKVHEVNMEMNSRNIKRIKGRS